MRNWKMSACALLSTTVLCSCASVPPVQPVAVECPVPPAPPAWTMQAQPSSILLLDRIITPFGATSSKPKAN